LNYPFRLIPYYCASEDRLSTPAPIPAPPIRREIIDKDVISLLNQYKSNINEMKLSNIKNIQLWSVFCSVRFDDFFWTFLFCLNFFILWWRQAFISLLGRGWFRLYTYTIIWAFISSFWQGLFINTFIIFECLSCYLIFYPFLSAFLFFF
jgi:hypothetical protein